MGSSESDTVTLFKEWLEAQGGGFHPHVRFSEVSSGLSVVAGKALLVDTTIVTCPFTLAITQEVSRRALSTLMNLTGSPTLASWSERQLICSYLCFHCFVQEPSATDILAHLPYLKTLPASENLRTPLHFTALELAAFTGTNLYGATLDRTREWQTEWGQCHAVVAAANAKWGLEFTWQIYLTASTYLSSRAFPSTILSPTPSLLFSPSTYPVLLPGIDSLNHARGQPISWVVTYTKDDNIPIDLSYKPEKLKEPAVSLVLHNPAIPGQELFNNYGTKPNSELILGYGFSIPQNPDDTIVLKIGGAGGKKWEVGRTARGADGVWQEILALVAQDPESESSYDDHLEAAGALVDMVQTLLDRLPPTKGECGRVEMRPEVALMLYDYVEGQRNILESVIEFAHEKARLAIEAAQAQGIELICETEMP